MNKLLLNELKERFELDQKLLLKKDWETLKQIYRENSSWLKKIIHSQGWLSEKIVGEQGELYAWLIVQHSDDFNFQKSCLKLLKNLPKTKERNQHVAYLTDKILTKENKKQIYGTQFSYGNPCPIFDKKNLDKRRAEMNLCPFKEYYSLMKNSRG